MLDLGAPELMIILLILLLFFGSTRLPKLAKTLGESIKEVRKGLDGDSVTELVTKKSKE